MQTIEVPGQKETLQIPSEWDELRPNQVIKILEYASMFTTGQMNYNKFIVCSFYIIADIKRNWISVAKEMILSSGKYEEKLNNIFIYAQQLTTFLFKPKAKKEKIPSPEEFYFNTVINYIPVFTAKSTKYYGPKNMLGDLTFGEFIGAIDAMNEYFQNRDEPSLNKFIANIYRPSSDGIKRIEFQEEKLANYRSDLSKVPAHIKFGILFWFSTCINYIKSEDIEIDGKEINLSVLFPKKSKNNTAKSTGIGWKSVLYGVAKEGVFGPIEKTNSTNLFEVLMFMYDSHLQAQKLKSQTK